MFVRTWMTTQLVTVEPEMLLIDAYACLKEKGIRRLPVVKEGKLRGILTLTDLQKLLHLDVDTQQVKTSNPKLLEVGNIMTTNPITVEPGDPIEKAALLMVENKISSIPVVSKGKLEGILTETDLFKAMVKMFGLREGGVRVTLEQKESPDQLEAVAAICGNYDVRIVSVARTPSSKKGYSLLALRLQGDQIDACVEEIRKGKNRIIDISE